MTQNREIAIYAYYQALRTIAHCAGHDFRPTLRPGLPANIKTLMAQAGELAQPPGPGGNSLNNCQPLQSIMGHLHSGDYLGYYLPRHISSHAAMPTTQMPGPEDMKRAYQDIWTKIKATYDDLEIANQTNAAVQEASLHALLQRYAWAIPAPVAGANDVSYFDYTRIRAALAVCLNPEDGATEPVDPETPALLVGADLSGVQEWLYTIASTGAAKSLRGRSVYLQLLMEVIALDLLDELKLPMANLLYVGGGNFYMVVPTHCQGAIKAYHKKASQNLLDMHQGALYMALASTPLKSAHLKEGQVGQAWKAITPLLGQQKLRRFAELGAVGMAKAIGNPRLQSGDPKERCAVCRRPITAEERQQKLTRKQNNPNNEDEEIGALCNTLIKLGRELSTASYLTLSRIPHQTAESEYSINNWHQGLACFGFEAQIPTDALEDNWRSWKSPANSKLDRIYFWQDSPQIEDFPGMPDKAKSVWSYRPLAQCVPLDEAHDTATFDIFDSEGIDYWGALRMDVDKLGNIFQQGIAPASLSRTVGLSSLMRLFFEGYAPTLAQKYNDPHEGNPDGKPRIQLMYAGGDDLFLVGGWSWLPGLADEIRQAFADFACQNPTVTISGGIALAHSDKYPLYRAADEAEKAEKKSKEGGRNAVTFLGETLPWQTSSVEGKYESYEYVSQRVAEMRQWLQSEGGQLPRSFIMNLREIDAEWRDWKQQETGQKWVINKAGERQFITPRYRHAEKSRLHLGPWQWHQIYKLTRLGERSRDRACQSNLKQLSDQLIEGEILTIGLAARWLEFLSRKIDVKLQG